MFLTNQPSIVLKKINSQLIDHFLIEQIIGCKKGEKVNATKQSWKKIIQQLKKVHCRLEANKDKDGNFEIEVISPNNVYDIFLEDSKLEEKIRTIPYYAGRLNLFQNLGDNVSHLANSYFVRKNDHLRILEFLQGYKKIFHLYSTKSPIRLIKLHSLTKDKSFLERPFFSINPLTIKVKNLIISVLESFLFSGEVSEFTSKKFRESKEVIIDYLHSLGYFEAEISHLVLQDQEGALNVHFLIDAGLKRTLSKIQINFDFQCPHKEKIRNIITKMSEEKIPTYLLLREELDPLGVSIKSIDTLLKEKDKATIEINITQKKNDILLESINFKNMNIPTRILYWHAVKNGLIMGKNIGDFNAYSSNLNAFMSLLQKHIGEPPEYADNREDPTSISITLTGKPQKFIRLITDKTTDDGFYKHILDFSNYNLSLNLIKISKYGVFGRLLAFIVSPGLRVKLSTPAEMTKNAGLCLPAKILFRHKNIELETEMKLNISFFSFFAFLFRLSGLIVDKSLIQKIMKDLKKTAENDIAIQRMKKFPFLFFLVHLLTHQLVDPEISTHLKYVNWLSHNLTLNKEKIEEEDKIFLNLVNNIQKYKSFSADSGTTFSTSIEHKNPFSNKEYFHFVENLSLHSSINHAIKLSSKDSLVFNLASSIYFSEKIESLGTAYKLNIPFSGLSEEEKAKQRIQRLLSFQFFLLHEAFDISQITSPLNFAAKIRLGFTSMIYLARFMETIQQLNNISQISKLIPLNFCIILDLTEQLAYSFCIIIGPKGFSFVISKPAKQVNYFPSPKLERII